MIYSTRFLRQSLATGVAAAYLVPAGFVAVVRAIDVVQAADNGGTAPNGSLLIAEDAGQIAFAVLNTSALFSAASWRGRQVIEAGDSLLLVVIGYTSHVSANGYLLSVAGP